MAPDPRSERAGVRGVSRPALEGLLLIRMLGGRLDLRFLTYKEKKSTLLLSPIHFIYLTLWTIFSLKLLLITTSVSLICPQLRFLLFIPPRTSKIWISNFTRWLIIWCSMLEKYIITFSWLLLIWNCISTVNYVFNLPNLWKLPW